MSNENLITRREFTLEWALAILSGATITISGCGRSSPTSPSPTPMSSDRTGSISANHGHTAVITAAQITTASGISLNILGSANHPHTVDVTQAELMQIGDGQQVSKQSSSDQGHTHTVTFN